MVFQMLLCGVAKKLYTYKLSMSQGAERWIVCTPLSINVFVTLAAHLEYHRKTIFETPCKEETLVLTDPDITGTIQLRTTVDSSRYGTRKVL
jgi:hypothetical protein